MFVYDGWNLIRELNESGVAQKDYVWGLDLSQSLQGAGSIGGMVAAVANGTQYLYFYGGNGNGGQVVDLNRKSILRTLLCRNRNGFWAICWNRYGYILGWMQIIDLHF